MFQLDFLRDFMIGGLAAAISKTGVAPIERDSIIKIEDGTAKKYTGIVNCFSRVAREEGLLALWRGNLANVIRYFPTQALNFAFKDQYKKIFNPFNPKTDKFKFFLGNVASGGAAGATSSLFVYPLDFARTRLAADIGKGKGDRQFQGLTDCLKKIYRSDGVKGLYQGFGVSVLAYVIYRGLYFGLFDSAKPFLLTYPAMNNFFCKFLVAQTITTVAGFISYPVDTVRRRLMMQSGRSQRLYKGPLDCIYQVNKKEGTKAFFKGGLSNVFRGIGGSMVLVLYDEIQCNLAPNLPKTKIE